VDHSAEVWTHEQYEKRLAENKAKYCKPEGMTKTEWRKEKSRKRKLAREEEKRRKKDWDLELHNTPKAMFKNEIMIAAREPCDCEAEKMRMGIYCNVCKVWAKAYKYVVNLFKDAAEGRSTYI
jgi:hypothetical protein